MGAVFEMEGQKMNFKQHCERVGIKYRTAVSYKQYCGLSAADTLAVMIAKKGHVPIYQKALAAGVSPNLIYRRIQKGWSEEKAFAEPSNRTTARQLRDHAYSLLSAGMEPKDIADRICRSLSWTYGMLKKAKQEQENELQAQNYPVAT